MDTQALEAILNVSSLLFDTKLLVLLSYLHKYMHFTENENNRFNQL